MKTRMLDRIRARLVGILARIQIGSNVFIGQIGEPHFRDLVGEILVSGIGIDRGKNFEGDVTLKFAGGPEGVTIESASPTIKHGDTEAKATLKATADASLGDFTVKVTGHPTKGADATNEFKITVTKKYDSTSVLLYQEALTGEGVVAYIDFVKDRDVLLRYTLTGTMVTSYHLSGGGDKPTESLSLNFEKVGYKQTPGGPPPPVPDRARRGTAGGPPCPGDRPTNGIERRVIDERVAQRRFADRTEERAPFVIRTERPVAGLGRRPHELVRKRRELALEPRSGFVGPCPMTQHERQPFDGEVLQRLSVVLVALIFECAHSSALHAPRR